MKIRKRSVPTRRSAAVWGREGTSRRKVNNCHYHSDSKAATTRNNAGLTLIEVLVVMVVAMMLILLFLPYPRRMSRAPRIQCVNNLRQTGLAFRIWEGDYSNSYPQAISQTNGGTMEFDTGANAFRHFQVMSNELSTPKVVFCPAETDRNRSIATNFFNFNNSNISFFVGVVSNDNNPSLILSGDHNLTNGTRIRNGLLELTSNNLTGWTAEMHNKVGNILLADGSVQEVSISGLNSAVANTGVPTNQIQMPILGP